MSIDIYNLFLNVTSILGYTIFRNFSIFNNQNTILICVRILSIKCKYPLVSHVSPNVEDASPIHCVHFKATKRDPHKSIKGLQVQLIAQVAFDCILFEKSSHK